MAFPPAFLDELRNRLSMSEIAGKQLRLTRAGREFKACCPFHNEKTPSFYINDDKQFFHCFGCGAHGDIIGFTMRHDRLSFPEAVEHLANLAGLEVPRDTPIEREKFDREKRLYQLLERATAWFEEQLFSLSGREALNYLHGRGLSDEGIRRFRLGYAPNDGQSLIRKMLAEKYTIDELIDVGLAKKSEERNECFSFFRNRVIFPVGDRKGRTVAFGGRVLGDGEPKYLNSPDHVLFHKGRLLYGLSRARAALAQNQPLIVAEGYMDVIALVEAGYSGAVAPLGTALTEDQLAALWKLLPPPETRDPSRDYSPLLCFDGDNAGWRAALRAMERALPLLTPAQTIRIATMPAGQDPDDLIRQSGKSAMDAILKQAKPMIEMIWDSSLANRRMQTPEDRGAFIAALKQRVGRIGNEALRKLYQDDIQKRLAAAFNWGGARTGEERGRDFRKGAAVTPFTRISRRPPASPRRLRERVLLALMINHPHLFDEFGEHLGHIAFEASEMESLRQRVTELLDGNPPPEPDDIYRHLAEADDPMAVTALGEVLSESTYMHFGDARPGSAPEAARKCWKSVWHHLQREKLLADHESARRHHAEEMSDDSYRRLMALREQIENLNYVSDNEMNEEAI
ncbi:MAG: DNA primase [Bdellovibrionales bacterium]